MHILNVLGLNHHVSRGDFQQFKKNVPIKIQTRRGTHRSKIHGKTLGGILSLRDDCSITDNEGLCCSGKMTDHRQRSTSLMRRRNCPRCLWKFVVFLCCLDHHVRYLCCLMAERLQSVNGALGSVIGTVGEKKDERG